MLARAKPKTEGGARIAIIMNGSPLFTGDAGSGESEIRRFILENDLLEALVALPEQLFYNTGIGTYIWLLTNRKDPERAGRVQLIDATSFWSPLKKSLGNKRRDIPPEKAADILGLLRDFEDAATRTVSKDGEAEEVTVSRVFPTTRFGFRKITVERPLRLNFQASEERIAAAGRPAGFRESGESPIPRRGRRTRSGGGPGPPRVHQDGASAHARHPPQGPQGVHGRARRRSSEGRNQAHGAAEEGDPHGALGTRSDRSRLPEPMGGGRSPTHSSGDIERVPLPDGDDPVDDNEIPASVQEFFDREVKPHAGDAWIATEKRDQRDGRVGLVGYEINFNRYFYRFRPPRPLAEIEADIRRIEGEMVAMLRGVAGGSG